MRPRAACTISLPVGVGLMSPGPIGVDGLTMTAGRPRSSISSRTAASAWNFDSLYGPIMSCGAARRLLVGDAALQDAEHRDAAGIDDALDPGRLRRQHQLAGALDIDPEHRRRVRHPQPVIGGDVKHIAAARHRRRQRGEIVERALGDLDLQPFEVAPVAVRPRQHPHLLAAAQQRPRHRRADKPGRAGHQAQPGRAAARPLSRPRLHPTSAHCAKPGARRTPSTVAHAATRIADGVMPIALRNAAEKALALRYPFSTRHLADRRLRPPAPRPRCETAPAGATRQIPC